MATSRAPTDGPAALRLDIDDDGVAWLVFDDPDRPVNILGTDVMNRLDGLLARIEEGARLDRVRALVVRSGKDGSFIAGADVDEIADITEPAEAEAKTREGQRILHRIHELPIPSVAAIDGTCLGGGTELALACTRRIAAERGETRIGLPEVKLGIIPGFGGTVRLPRLIGLREALGIILPGKTVDARKAARIGLVDEVVPTTILTDRARAMALEAQSDRPRPRRRPLMQRLLEGNPFGRRIVLRAARKRVLRETGGHYPAPLAAIDTIRKTWGRPVDEALKIEARAVAELVVTDVCKNLIHVFRLVQGAKKAAPESAARPVERVAVLGAGVMGGGIAQLLAYRGLRARIKDIREAAIGDALRHARSLFDRAVKRRRLTRDEADEGMGRIEPTLDYSGFGAADVVIEAVVERMDVKKQVLAEVEREVPASCVLTSNTSALSITEMQHALDRPENLCGMHFFNPVHRMPLVEVVRGAATSDEAVATIFDLTLRLGKTPVIVNDGPGFLVNRLLAPYLNEAGWLLSEGVSIEDVDRALKRFGMPMGPFRLLDEVGLDVARHAAVVLYEAFGDRLRPAPPLEALERTDRLGRKGGLGFYRYEDGREKGIDDEVYASLGDAVPAERRSMPAGEIVDRCVLVMVNEAARALDDGVVDRAADVDLALITGTGFPPFRGGLLRWADDRGLPDIVDTLARCAHDLGGRFEPAPMLRSLVADHDAGFYGATGGRRPAAAD